MGLKRRISESTARCPQEIGRKIRENCRLSPFGRAKSFRPPSFVGKRNGNFCKDKQLRFSGAVFFWKISNHTLLIPHSTLLTPHSLRSQTLHSSSRNRYGAAAFLPKCSCNIKPCSKEQNRRDKKQQSLNLLHRPSPPFLFWGDPASGRASGKARPLCFWRRGNQDFREYTVLSLFPQSGAAGKERRVRFLPRKASVYPCTPAGHTAGHRFPQSSTAGKKSGEFP